MRKLPIGSTEELHKLSTIISKIQQHNQRNSNFQQVSREAVGASRESDDLMLPVLPKSVSGQGAPDLKTNLATNQ